MSILAWILLILIVLSVILVVLLFLIKPREPKQPDIAGFIDAAKPPNPWTEWGDVTGGTRNTCAIYTFPGTMNGTVAVPGQPTLDSAVLNSMQPDVWNNQCYDVDQIVAQEQQRTCQASSPPGMPMLSQPNTNGMSTSGTSGICIGTTGQSYTPGQTEIAYIPCQASSCSSPSCQGEGCLDTLALIALNFTNISAAQCLVGGAQVSVTQAGQCNISDDNQLWRIQRVDPVTLNPDYSGPYARITNRATGQCLVPLENIQGSSLVLGNCEPNGGYVWLLAPSIQLQESVTPQQIIYSTSITQPDLSTILTQNPQAMTIVNGTPQLQPAATNALTQSAYNAQYLDYYLYNIIANATTTEYPFWNPSI